MQNPWDQDEIIAPAPSASGNPWDSDEIVGEESPLEIDIVGGTRVPDAQFEQEVNPSLFRMDSDFRERSGAGIGTMLAASAKDMFGSRKGAAEFLAKKTGGQVRDQNGEPTLVLPDGTAYRLNDPGIDFADVANVAGNIAAFWQPAAWAARLGQARNVSLAGRSALQGLTAGATDVGLQLGFDGRVDPLRTGAAVAGGSSGEVVGTGIGALAKRAGAAQRSMSGANQQEANALLRLSGVESPQPAAVNRLAAEVPQLQAGANPNALMGREMFGFQYTQGQRMTDPARKFDLLSREEVLRQQPGAAHVFDAANRNNQQALGDAVAGIGERLGGRAGATPAELAQGAAGRVQQQASALDTRIGDAYEQAGRGARTAVGVDAVSALPDRLSAAVADFGVDPQLHPAASRTLAQIRESAGQVAQGDVKGVTLKAIETQRRIINNNVSAAANPSDRAATLAIKREFDGWLDDAVETALVSGDPAALQALKDARALRFEFGRRFEGKTDADKFIAGLLDGSKTPEELVNIALGASGVSKAGGARFIERLRAAADNDPEVIGNLRAAHFQRMVIGNNGEPLAMGQIVRNIKATEYNNASIVKALYTPAEWGEIRRLAASLDPLIAKGDFARTSGTAERMARMMFQGIGGGVADLPVVRGIMQGVGAVRAGHQANQALNKPLKLRAQAPAGFVQSGSAITQEKAR